MTTAITFPSVKEIETISKLTIVVNSPETSADAQKHLARIRLASKNLKTDVAAAKRPYKDAIDLIDQAAKPWANNLSEQDQALERAILAYNNKVRAAVAASNAKALDKYETKVATKEAEAIANNKPMPLILPPALKSEPAKTVHTEEARLTESGYWTWDGISGIADGVKGAKDLTYSEAQRLNLDLPAEWFTLDTALVTACVKKDDRVPKCVLKRWQEKIVVTATR